MKLLKLCGILSSPRVRTRAAYTFMWVCVHYFWFVFYFVFVCLFIWLCWVFIACKGLSLVAVSKGDSLIVVHGLLTAVASLVAEHVL